MGKYIPYRKMNEWGLRTKSFYGVWQWRSKKRCWVTVTERNARNTERKEKGQ